MTAYRLQKLLWDLRRSPALAARFKEAPDAVGREYGLSEEQVRWLTERDVKTLYEQGLNPYLLYFGSLQLGVSRPEYYERLRGQRPPGA